MRKKVKSTVDELVESLSAKEKKAYDEEFKELVLSELVLALMEQDEISVRKLAKLANVSPTVIQAMRSGKDKDYNITSFFKVLKGLGIKKFMFERNGKIVTLSIPNSTKK